MAEGESASDSRVQIIRGTAMGAVAPDNDSAASVFVIGRPGGQWQQLIPPFFGDGGTSLAGFREKKPAGLSVKPMYAEGMTG
ncbi:MAG: hypothetical protein JWN86_202 [Planctomycetota bacterium]|nr:hypothetical protein [Planctomycetota bacterium]